MHEYSLAEGTQCLLNPVAQPLPHAAPFVDTKVEVLLQPRVGDFGASGWKACSVQQAVCERELGILVAVEDPAQIELDVGRAREALAVTQQPQLLAVGDQTPHGIRTVEVLLDRVVR